MLHGSFSLTACMGSFDNLHIYQVLQFMDALLNPFMVRSHGIPEHKRAKVLLIKGFWVAAMPSWCPIESYRTLHSWVQLWQFLQKCGPVLCITTSSEVLLWSLVLRYFPWSSLVLTQPCEELRQYSHSSLALTASCRHLHCCDSSTAEELAALGRTVKSRRGSMQKWGWWREGKLSWICDLTTTCPQNRHSWLVCVQR